MKLKSEMFRAGMKVVRGPDWCWEEQDGGAGKVGITRSDPYESFLGLWVGVDWPKNRGHSYQVGADNCFDIQPAGQPCPLCRKTCWLHHSRPFAFDECGYCGCCISWED
ncbi:MAG: hypothetical protein V1755_05665 [Chloroflexota bacterium]